jgi:hypothetical protein
VAPEVTAAIRILVMRKPATTLLELLDSLTLGTADDLYFLIATDQVYVDLSQTPLADPGHVHVFTTVALVESQRRSSTWKSAKT